MNKTGERALITGGSGTIGKAIAQELLARGASRVVLLSRNEYGQWLTRWQLVDAPELCYFLGDVRDRNRMDRAMWDVDTVYHTAALKHIDMAEANPEEIISVNVDGTRTALEAALHSGVSRFVLVSTGGAESPCNLYELTKKLSEELVHRWDSDRMCCIVQRLESVIGGRGSLLDAWWRAQDRCKPLEFAFGVTRFFVERDEAARRCVDAASNCREVVGRHRAATLMQLAEAAFPTKRKINCSPGRNERTYETIHGERSDQPSEWWTEPGLESAATQALFKP